MSSGREQAMCRKHRSVVGAAYRRLNAATRRAVSAFAPGPLLLGQVAAARADVDQVRARAQVCPDCMTVAASFSRAPQVAGRDAGGGAEGAGQPDDDQADPSAVGAGPVEQ